jgi:hypothetical protein
VTFEIKEQQTFQVDSAAVFACAFSLWEACLKSAEVDSTLNLSACYNGIDQLMREVLRIGNEFESWACHHVSFDNFSEVWPYMLADKFGPSCIEVLSPGTLANFNEKDCLRIALHLRLPVKLSHEFPVPIDIRVNSPLPGNGFREFRIQTVRDCGDGHVAPFSIYDDPFDDEFGPLYFGIYGVDEEGELEHIADRKNYLDAVELLQKLVPGIEFPHEPTAG